MRGGEGGDGEPHVVADPPTEVDLPEREPPYVEDPVAPERTRAEIEALVTEGMSFIEPTARALSRLFGARLDLDELRGPAHEALFDAARTFDPARSSFATFARKKIRWAMLNAIRKHQDARAQRRAHALRVADRLREVYAEEPVDAELPESSHGASLRAKLLAEATAMAVAITVRPRDAAPEQATTSGDASALLRGQAEVATPEQELQSRSLEEALRASLERLPPRQRSIVERHYWGGERFDRIAAELGVSKSWVSRLHQQAMESLTKLLADHA